MNSSLSLRDASRISLITSISLGAVLALAFFGIQYANASISSSLDIGSTGPQVTELQTYLSTDSNLYPSGKVTGYFGALTEGGVQKFQVREGIVSSGTPASTGYGRVGPSTRARLNALMGSGPVTSGDTVPVMSTPTVSVTNTTATFTWNTNEVTQGQVYWDTTMLRSDEATGPHQQPFISGSLAIDAGGVQTVHSVTVSNLQTNTTYFYIVRSIDSVGNVTMIMPQTFKTNF